MKFGATNKECSNYMVRSWITFHNDLPEIRLVNKVVKQGIISWFLYFRNPQFATNLSQIWAGSTFLIFDKVNSLFPHSLKLIGHFKEGTLRANVTFQVVLREANDTKDTFFRAGKLTRWRLFPVSINHIVRRRRRRVLFWVAAGCVQIRGVLVSARGVTGWLMRGCCWGFFLFIFGKSWKEDNYCN